MQWWQWLLAAFGVLLALALFVLWLRGTFRGRYCYKFENTPPATDPAFLRVLPGVSDSMVAPGRVTGFYSTPEAIYRVRLQAIARARQAIDMETYYIVPGRRADELADALIAKAREGVKVRFIADSQGVMLCAAGYWQRLLDGGIDLRFYNRFELGAPAEYLSRTHRKLLIIDGDLAFVGGTGVSDEWDGDPKRGETAPWADVEVALEGPIVDRLLGTFLRQWACLGGAIDFAASGARPDPSDQPVLVTTGNYTSGVSPLGVLYQTYMAAARKKLWIASPYFLPDTTTRQALVAAAKRGADVRIVTMGPRNDRIFVYHASRELYGELLEAGVRIFEYQPSLMHAKALIVDDAWATLGSANVDPMSFFSNAELNVSAGQEALLGPLGRWFHEVLQDSAEVQLPAWRQRAWWVCAHGWFWLRFRRVL